MRLVINTIDIFSAAKIGCFVHLILGASAAFFVFMFNSVALGILTDVGFKNTAVGLLGAQCALLVGAVVVAGLSGLIMWGLGALIYNIAAGMFGGVEMHLSKANVERRPIYEDAGEEPPPANAIDKPKREKLLVRREIVNLEQEIRAKNQRLQELRNDIESRF